MVDKIAFVCSGRAKRDEVFRTPGQPRGSISHQQPRLCVLSVHYDPKQQENQTVTVREHQRPDIEILHQFQETGDPKNNSQRIPLSLSAALLVNLSHLLKIK